MTLDAFLPWPTDRLQILFRVLSGLALFVFGVLFSPATGLLELFIDFGCWSVVLVANTFFHIPWAVSFCCASFPLSRSVFLRSYNLLVYLCFRCPFFWHCIPPILPRLSRRAFLSTVIIIVTYVLSLRMYFGYMCYPQLCYFCSGLVFPIWDLWGGISCAFQSWYIDFPLSFL